MTEDGKEGRGAPGRRWQAGPGWDREARRRFGQNFLVDQAEIRGIVEDIPCNPGDWLIEIGPGQGALTRRLVERCTNVTVVEIDPKWAQHLRSRSWPGNLEIVEADAARVDIDDLLGRAPGRKAAAERSPEIFSKPWVAGNLPYNRAAPILFHFLPRIRQFLGMYVMVQYEVAKRICAEPRRRDFGFLSVFVQNLAVPRLLRRIPPEAFRPRPKVFSATVELLPRGRPFAEEPEFLPFAQRCFSQKRKKLVNSLHSFYPKEAVNRALEGLGLSPDVRAEELEVERMAALFRALGA